MNERKENDEQKDEADMIAEEQQKEVALQYGPIEEGDMQLV